MKRYLPLSLLLLANAGIYAQITVTSSTFPVIGDTLKMAFDYSPVGIVALTPPGGSQIWDFSSLEVDTFQNLVYLEASLGNEASQVPGAEMFTNPSPDSEYYYNLTPEKFELMAYNGPDPYDIGFSALFRYNPPLVERRAPVNFFDINVVSSGVFEGFHSSELPPAFVASLPVTVDSLRYRISISRTDVVDAWGSVIIPSGTYNVLREKRTQYCSYRLDAKITPLGWLDITDIVIQSGSVPNLGIDTIVSFHFHNDVAKEPIAIVTMNNPLNAATQVVFKNIAVVSAIEKVNAANPSVTISPNPAGNEAVMSYKNFVSGMYRLVMYDDHGRIVQQKSLLMSGNSHEQLNLSRLLPGIYMVTLFDENNRLLCQQKLMKSGG